MVAECVTAVRVICLAPSYKKYDLHAVQVMGASIEPRTYRRPGQAKNAVIATTRTAVREFETAWNDQNSSRAG